MSAAKKKTTVQTHKAQTYKPASPEEKRLIKAFLELKTEQQVADFLRDLMTTSEIEEFAQRLEIARLLLEKEYSYQEIAKEVSTSTTTVTRVALWLFKGCGGYAHVLTELKKKG